MSTNRSGAIPSQIIEQFIANQRIISDSPVPSRNIQPASLDLRLKGPIYKVKAAFLPQEGESIAQALQRYAIEEQQLQAKPVLQVHQTYIIEIRERFNLPSGVHAYTNNKSSTGRLNVWVRTLVNGLPRFDLIPKGYTGEAYVMVTPRSWPIKIGPDTCLNQARFLLGNNQLTDLELEMAQESIGLVFDKNGRKAKATFDRGLLLTADLEQNVVGYEAINSSQIIDLTSNTAHDASLFFQPLQTDIGELLLQKGKFYILSTCEYIRVPPRHAVEMVAYDIHSGEFRSHYAGFFDPGFGYGREGKVLGTPAVLEVDPHEDVIIRHGQPICKMIYEHLIKTPHLTYGEEIASHYQYQRGPQLGRHFAPFPPSNVTPRESQVQR